jgi:hypothetical protein
MDIGNPYLDALTALSSAPGFSQPILPGWTINVNSNNSTSPRTEGLVVSKFSYGHQLGRISDALEAIVATLPEKTKTDKDIVAFMKMKAAIDVLKAVG